MQNEVNRALVAKKKFNKTNMTMRKYISLGGLRAVLMVLLVVLGVGNTWAGSSTKDHKTKLTVSGGDTGKGLVYAAKVSNATVEYVTSKTTDESNTNSKNSSETHTYYAWASPVRGYTFNGWTKSNAATSSTSNPYTVTVSSSGSLVTGTLTASWTEQSNKTVTYNVPSYGAYSVSYTGLKYNSTNKTIETTTVVSQSLSGKSTSAETVKTYAGDQITLTSTDGIFLGWYDNASGTGTALSTNSTYTFTYNLSTSPTSIYAIYDHVETYYGKLTGSIGTSSVPAGGTICVSKAATDSPTYSDEAQQVTHSSTGSTSLKYYLYAKPNDGRYVLRGWYTDAACTTPVSATKVGDHYEYTLTSSSTNEASPTTGNIYAAFDFNLYYLQVDAKPATLGLGKVLVKDQAYATAPSYTLFTDSASQFGYVLRTPAMTKSVYLYAKPKYGYKFSGWYDNAACSGSAKSTANPYTYSATGTSMDPAHPTITTLYAKFVPAADGDKVSITYKIPDQTKGEYTASVLDIQEIDDEFVWTFTEVYNSVDYTTDKSLSQHKTDVLRLEAACKDDYGVKSWTEGSTTKTTPSYLYETPGTAAKTLSVAFEEAMPFMVSANNATTGTRFATLADALANRGSNTKITVVQNAYIPAIEGGYTIPSGVTLLVPNDENYAIMTKGTDIQENFPALSPYIKLTIGAGVEITVNGAICIAASQRGTSSSNPGPGMPCGAYGSIDMSQGGHITINNGANLYAFGFIFGGGDKTSTGTITIKSGGTVYEDIIVNDMPGGGGTAACVNGTSASNNFGLFPFSQYFVQNVEPRMTIEHGGKEKVVYDIQSGFGGQQDVIDLIGNANTFLFQTTATGSSVTKWYDYSRDYQCYEVTGSMTMNKISINAADILTMSSDKFVLPLNNNMDITVKSGATMTLPYDVKLLPGAKLKIEEGATVEVKKGFYVYDYEDWDFFGGSASGSYAQTVGGIPGHTVRTVSSKAALGDASLVVNGTLKLSSSAAFYTTSHGSSVISDGTGQIVFDVAGKSEGQNLYERWGTYGKKSNGAALGEGQTDAAAGQVLVGSYTMTFMGVTLKGPYYVYGTPVATTPAKLCNGDNSYVLTAGAAKNDKFIYSKNLDKWLKNPKTVTWNANGGTSELESMAYSEGAFVGVLPTATREGYTFNGWFTLASGGSQISETQKVTANVEYFAHWTPKQYDITYMDQGKAAFSSTHIDSPNAHPTKHTYGTATTLNSVNNKTGYNFGGWHTISNCKAESKVTSLAANGYTKDIILYAKWTPQEYAITYKDKGDAAFSGTSWASTQPTKHTYGTATTLVNPSKANYTFGGWYTTSACTGSAVTSLGETAYTSGPITLYAKWNETTHKVTVAAGTNGSVSPTSVSGVGVATASGNITATPNTGYIFSGWTLPESGVTAASGYTTSSNPIHINATADGKTITANFAVVSYNVTYTAPSNGSYTIKVADAAAVSANTTAQYNQTIVLSATPAEGYKFDHWTVTKASSGTVTVTNNQFTMPAEAVTVRATFVPDVSVLTIGVNNAEYGSVSPTSVPNVPFGSNVSVNSNTFTVNGTTVTATPAAQTDSYTYAFDHWENLPATVTGDVNNIQAVFTRTPRYTITWQVDGVTVKTEKVDQGTIPSYGADPAKANDDSYAYTFNGWSPEVSSVTGDATYTATYLATPLTLVVSNEKEIEDNIELSTVTITTTGELNIEEGATLTTNNLILEASTAASGELTGNVVADNVYFDLILNNESNRRWNAFTVPFQVNLKESTGKRAIINGEALMLGRGYDIVYYDGAERAAHGKTANCWKYVEDGDSTLYPGQAYMIASASRAIVRVRFTAELDNTGKPIGTTGLTVLAGEGSDGGWNGIGNPNMYHSIINAGPAVGYVHDGGKIGEDDYIEYNIENLKYVVGKAVYVQVYGSGTSDVDVSPATDQDVITPFSAPRRNAPAKTDKQYLSLEDYYKISISSDNGIMGSNVYVLGEEDKEDAYIIGHDLAKLNMSNVRAQMWIERYDNKLCMNTTALINNKAIYPLGLYIPQAGEYTISNQQSVAGGQTSDMLYLTYDGRVIWNLTYSPYTASLEKGTNNHYGLRLVHSNTPTDVEQIQTEGSSQQILKVLIDDKVYILRGGEIYTVTGQKAK